MYCFFAVRQEEIMDKLGADSGDVVDFETTSTEEVVVRGYTTGHMEEAQRQAVMALGMAIERESLATTDRRY